MPPTLKVFSGNRDVVQALEEAAELARTGQLHGVAICGIGGTFDALGYGWHFAWNDELPTPWANILAAVVTADHELRFNGLTAGQ